MQSPSQAPSKNPIKPYETIIAVVYVGWVIGAYLLGLVFLNMYTSEGSAALAWWVCGILFPAAVYIALRGVYSSGSKWYGFFGYFLGACMALFMTGYYTSVKTELLVSALLKPTTAETLKIKDIEKIVYRKSGWDRTDVTFIYHGQPLTLEASRTAYFLLQHKKQLGVKIGRSYSGNYFVTDIDLPQSERWTARWLYLKDWGWRYLWVPIVIVALIGLISIRVKFFPNVKPIKWSWQKTLLVIMGSIVGVVMLLYVGLVIYVKFIYKA
ncbi:hypothetical protein DYU05_12640 [Mucilaginibacter terrenus]|uniref:Uncharacterized protein n=1 Tax=Mucilaginibacter terrenus TaxID=2482727 RepID=A0A3E2NPR3_9SPHI|nr:hypothetical protein [Mucilaginibacter terrenus]RFZ82995.1 hypothetical protein DYU05_12640 [Mucilaginibacter terrenus]